MSRCTRSKTTCRVLQPHELSRVRLLLPPLLTRPSVLPPRLFLVLLDDGDVLNKEEILGTVSAQEPSLVPLQPVARFS